MYSLSRNIVVAILAFMLVGLLYLLIPGYRWAVEEIGFKNLNLVKKIEDKRRRDNLPPLTVHEKRAFKIENYYYMQLINNSTPQNAVILLPPRTATQGSRHTFLGESEWVAYFIYPRLCVGEDEKDKLPELYKKVTHIAIVKGWGYDKLKYVSTEKEDEIVLPINKASE